MDVTHEDCKHFALCTIDLALRHHMGALCRMKMAIDLILSSPHNIPDSDRALGRDMTKPVLNPAATAAAAAIPPPPILATPASATAVGGDLEMLHSLLQAGIAHYRANINVSDDSILATQRARLARRVLEV